MGIANIIHHSGLPGLANDDHTQYLRADGARALAGPWDMASQEVSNINLLTGLIANAVTHSLWDAAYAHSIDSSQAHSDYLINNNDDSTSGTLTAAGFTTAGVVQAEHLISKDDIDMEGHLFTMGDGENPEIVLKFLGLFGGFTTMTTNSAGSIFSGIVTVDALFAGGVRIGQPNTVSTSSGALNLAGFGREVTINGEYALPKTFGPTGHLVTAAGNDGELTYTNPATLSVALAAAVTVANSTDETSFIAMFDSATGNLPIRTETGLTYNSATKSLAIGGDLQVDGMAGIGTVPLVGTGLTVFSTNTADIDGVGINALLTVIPDANNANSQSGFVGGLLSTSPAFDLTGILTGVKGNCVIFDTNGQTFDDVVGTIGRAQVLSIGGTFNLVAGLRATTVITNVGATIPNVYGLLVDDVTGGTDNWAIKTGVGKVSFGDETTIGDGTNELVVSATGDFSFKGTGGFIEGHMTIPSVDIVVDTSANDDPVEVADDGTGVPGAGDGWASVYQNGVTFAVSDLHYQTVTIPGAYKVIWDQSPKTDAGGGTVIHGGIMIDGVAVRDNGEGHAHIFNANDNIQINGIGVIDCPNGNEEISLWISNNANQKTLIEHGNMNIQLIGGT